MINMKMTLKTTNYKFKIALYHYHSPDISLTFPAVIVSVVGEISSSLPLKGEARLALQHQRLGTFEQLAWMNVILLGCLREDQREGNNMLN